MTTPRDDIAGLVIAELVDEIKDRRSHPAYPHHLDDLLDEAATQLDALSARVKELGVWQGIAQSTCKKFEGYVVKLKDAEARTLRAEQERDEAYERAIRAVRDERLIDPVDSHDQTYNDALGHAEQAIRRLAAGPEKEEKE